MDQNISECETIEKMYVSRKVAIKDLEGVVGTAVESMEKRIEGQNLDTIGG